MSVAAESMWATDRGSGMKRVGRFLMDDIRSVFELPWMRIASRFESFRGFIGLIGRLYLAFLAVLIASVPAVLLNSDRDHVLGYVAASQLLVNLSWLIVAWAGSALVGVMIVSLVSELRFSVVQAAVGSSVARIATWTGRLGLPFLLGSVVAWVFGLAGDGGSPASILRSIAVLQVAMLLVSLTTMITIESVRVVFRAAEGLPWTFRIPCAVCFPFVGWLAARRVWHLEPTAIRVFESIAPARIAGIDRGLYGSALPEVLLQVPWGVGLGVFLLIAVVLTISWARRSRRAVEDARPA
jgi:hypothetical protein